MAVPFWKEEVATASVTVSSLETKHVMLSLIKAGLEDERGHFTSRSCGGPFSLCHLGWSILSV